MNFPNLSKFLNRANGAYQRNQSLTLTANDLRKLVMELQGLLVHVAEIQSELLEAKVETITQVEIDGGKFE